MKTIKKFIVNFSLIATLLALGLSCDRSKNETSKLIENELKFAEAASFIFGKEIAKKFNGSKALVIVDENFKNSKRQQRMFYALEKALNDKVKITLAMPDIRREKKKAVPMWERMRAINFDKLIDENKDCNLIISFIGLPCDMEKMKIWELDKNKRPKIALLFADVHNLKSFIQDSSITALTYKPNVKFTEDPCPKDPEKAFAERYTIIDSKNIDKIADQ